MEEAEHSGYVAQLKAEFDSCDAAASGFLDRDQLVALCHKLQLDTQLPPLLHLLLGERNCTRVNFQEFKEAFVSLLSRSVDVSTSEDDSSYLEPVVPVEVKPKLVKGAKRYGRRSRPDSKSDAALTRDSDDSPQSRTETSDSSPPGLRRAKLRRSTSLESVESLKSDEEAGSQKIAQDFQSKAYQQQEGEEPITGCMASCDHLQHLNTTDRDSLLRKMDADIDSRGTVGDFHDVLCGSAPMSCSTPARPGDLQRALLLPHRDELLSEERSLRSTSPSLLTATVGQKVLSRLDDGSGCTSPERVIALWTEEGIKNSRNILQTLDFPLEERLSLTDLTLALDNELLVSGNGIHQAALISYKNEIQHLQVLSEQACRQRDKVRADLDQADQRNLKLVREVDDRHANMETLNQSRIRELEQEYRDRLSTLRCQSEQESEAATQQADRERRALTEELMLLRAQEEELRAELRAGTQENSRLEEELCVVKLKLSDAENSVNKLQRDLDQVLHDKFGVLDAAGSGLSHEERFGEIVKECELQCRELRDRNDELSSELELLKSHRSDRKSKRSAGGAGDTTSLIWTEQAVSAESDCDDSDVKRLLNPEVKEEPQQVQNTGVPSLGSSVVPGPGVSIQTELALEQMKQNHEEELQELRVQLETQVNFYERSLELMRQNMEVERKDIAQAFKLEISELEEHKAQAEQQVKQLKEALDKLQTQQQSGGRGGGWSSEQERRVQRERAELEQNFAREIGNLVERLRAEKDQLEAELKLKMDQEVMLVRVESEQKLSQVEQESVEAQRGLWEQHQEALRSCALRISQSEHSLQEIKRRCADLEDELCSSRRRCAELEEELCSSRGRCAELEDELCSSRGRCSQLVESCSQLQESMSFLESREILSKRLETEKSEMEAELQRARSREGELYGQVMQLKEELGRVRVVSDNLLQQQIQLRVRDQTILGLRAELERLQDGTKTRAAELDSLKTDRARLIQDLKEQAMAVDKLQLQLDAAMQELELSRKRSCEENLQQEEELGRLRQENLSYSRLADQLSTQIVEMEAEISSLREQLRGLSAQLNDTADLVLRLRTQLNDRTCEEERLRRGLQEAQDQQRATEEELEGEKKKMRQQLMELEMLVLALEGATHPTSPHRTQLEEVRVENSALQERLKVLQQDVHSLEEDISKKKRKVEDLEQEHQRSREEEERLHRENCRYREEVLELSSRNLQLSNDNAELSARLRGDQESLRMLQERLATVSKEQEEGGTEVRRLQAAASQQEREKTQQQTSWTQERRLLEAELSTCKEKLGRLAELEAELSATALKLQFAEQDKRKLLSDVEDRNRQVEALQRSVVSLESQAELIRSQIHTGTREKLGHAQEVTDLQRKLEDAHNKEEELQRSVQHLLREKEEQSRALAVQEEQASITLREETHRLTLQNQELQHKLTELQVKGQDVQKLSQEQQNLKTRLTELQVEKVQATQQAVHADTTLSLVRAQHTRQLQELQERAGGGVTEKEAEQLEEQLKEEQRRSRQLEETLQRQAQQITVKQEQFEKAASALQLRSEELELKLKAVQTVLQEKVEHLKEQLAENTKASTLLKTVIVENSDLMVALQVTEQRQKQAEKKNFLLQEKMGALHRLLRDVVTAAMAT